MPERLDDHPAEPEVPETDAGADDVADEDLDDLAGLSAEESLGLLPPD